LTAWGKIGSVLLRLYSLFIHNQEFEVDKVLSEDEFSLVEYGIPGKVIHIPGYTQGSVSVLLEDGKAFVGDLAMNWFPLRLSPGLPIFGDDTQVVIESWRKILDMGAKTIFPAHGKPFSAEVMRKVVI
jgi:glyoxylase-like metal-dependent hydrolase (beta-lactamase superfamily II)